MTALEETMSGPVNLAVDAATEPLVAEIAGMLNTICGTSATGSTAACGHDHTGQAAALIKKAQVTILRELGSREAVLSADGMLVLADELEAQLS